MRRIINPFVTIRDMQYPQNEFKSFSQYWLCLSVLLSALVGEEGPVKSEKAMLGQQKEEEGEA